MILYQMFLVFYMIIFNVLRILWCCNVTSLSALLVIFLARSPFIGDRKKDEKKLRDSAGKLGDFSFMKLFHCKPSILISVIHTNTHVQF